MAEDDISQILLDISLEKEFTRSATLTQDLESLYTVAYELFGRWTQKKNISSLESQDEQLRQMLEIMAAIISKTYVECGESFQLADDDALMLIRDQLIQYNPAIIARNKNNRLPRGIYL